VKLKDIEVGELYAVSIDPQQVQNLPAVSEEDEEWGVTESMARGWINDTERTFSGHKSRVVGIEEVDGRKLVRVECESKRARVVRRDEDNLDGTHTMWRGIVLDEDENVVRDEITFEALIQPSQVYEAWIDAQVARGVRRMEHDLKAHPERILGRPGC
jgi:hypothetical protein